MMSITGHLIYTSPLSIHMYSMITRRKCCRHRLRNTALNIIIYTKNMSVHMEGTEFKLHFNITLQKVKNLQMWPWLKEIIHK
jgi:hypothetical protein